MLDVKRRAFITLLGGAAAAWPVRAISQQAMASVIGFLSARSHVDSAGLLVSFRKGLTEGGYVEGQNVRIEYRFAEGQYDRLAALAADLVGRQVAVIAAISGTPAALAAKAATTTIPIVFANGADPIASGLVTSLNRPGGNISGVTFLASETIPKRLQVLHELMPRAQAVGYLVNPENPITEGEVKNTAAAARQRGLQLLVYNASTKGAIDDGFASFAQRRVDALIIGNDTFLSSRKEQIFTRAAQHAIPTIYYEREFAVAGGLLSYGTDFADSYRQAGLYVTRILKGSKPADLPVQQPTKFELVINLKTAKALGVEVPPTLLARADEVIE
jgi:putative ABC transport system substrate-binding protein